MICSCLATHRLVKSCLVLTSRLFLLLCVFSSFLCLSLCLNTASRSCFVRFYFLSAVSFGCFVFIAHNYSNSFLFFSFCSLRFSLSIVLFTFQTSTIPNEKVYLLQRHFYSIVPHFFALPQHFARVDSLQIEMQFFLFQSFIRSEERFVSTVRLQSVIISKSDECLFECETKCF